MAVELTSSFFVRELHRALQDLYDPVQLRKSVLVNVFGNNAREGASALRQLLLDAIEALKPPAGIPEQGRAWRTHRVLFHRYVVQFSQSEVAQTLGVSLRQLRREDSRSLRVLADYLWRCYDLARVASQAAASPATQQEEQLVSSQGLSREQELQWLGRSLPSEAVTVGETIQAALKTAEPLLRAHQVSTDSRIPDLPHVACPSAALRHAVLNILTAAIRSVPGGRVVITAERYQDHIRVCVQPIAATVRGGRPVEGYADSLQMARQLLALAGGALETVSSGNDQQPFTANLTLPVVEQYAVLIIDDNSDALHLMQRYLAGTCYPFIGVRDPQQALPLVEKLNPRIIVLDVMLPGIDGWELLQRLREDPITRTIPVIVCTILPEEHLALAIGAAAFLRKPVSRQDFLAALDRQVENLAKG